MRGYSSEIFGRLTMKKNVIITLGLAAALTFASICPVTAEAAGAKTIKTGITKEVYAEGQYDNWDGVPTVAQFTGSKGDFCFAFKKGSKIKVVLTKSGKVSKKINLKMVGDKFGSVASDSDGNFYAVTGKDNSGDDTTRETVFITKYNSSGKLIKTVGDNGSSSLADYYDSSFYTKEPFSGGTCDIAVNGDYVAVNYGRHMYSGHQSNSVWIIDKNTMKSARPEGFTAYESHSFGQRVVSHGGGFAFMSEGDCYDRAFTFSSVDPASNSYTYETPVFDFWVKKGTLDEYNMYVLNDNFAHIGNLCSLNDGMISFVSSSAKSMNKKAANQREQIFIQIFDPTKDLTSSEAYVTSGKREGTAGPNGNEKKVNYGVKWLTKYSSGNISEPQAVTDGKGNTIVLFERYGKNYNYSGVYAMKVDSKGNITKKATRISKTAHLNSCETPEYCNGYIYWCGNKDGYDAKKDLLVYKLKF